MANSYDGALDEKGESIKVGLKREEGHVINDSRVMDGFGVKFHGDKLIITYHGECDIKEVQNPAYESEIEGMIQQVATHLKKEYKKLTGSGLSLTKDADPNVLVQKMSNVRTWVQAQMPYRIGGMSGVDTMGEGTPEDRLEDNIKKFLELGKGPKPKNVTRKN